MRASHNHFSTVLQDHSGSSFSAVDVVQATALCSGHQKGPWLIGPAAICSTSHMANKSKQTNDTISFISRLYTVDICPTKNGLIGPKSINSANFS